MKAWILAAALAVAACMVGPAVAAPLGEREARAQLFGVRGTTIQFAQGLGQGERAVLNAFLTNDQYRVGQRYYGAVAVSPDFFTRLAAEPAAAAMSGLMQITENFHSPEAAGRAALSACEAARAGRGSACKLAAYVLPRDYAPRALTLSVTATEAFRVYRRTQSPKAFAISPSTGQYYIAGGADAEAAAVAGCNRTTGGASDCVVVVRN